MMSKHLYEGEVLDRATSRESLETRLDMNKRFQSTDFDSWLMDRLSVVSGEDILDVGCGTGAQSIPSLNIVGSNGSVSSLDMSGESVNELIRKAGNATNLHAVVSDMGELEEVIEKQFSVKQYDLAQSSYALYYSPRRIHVLDVMRNHLKPNGRLAVFTPNAPHGMVEFARQFSEIPEGVDECMVFGPNVLESYFRKHFWNVKIHFFHNIVRVPNVEDFLIFYKSTTYYKSDAEEKICAAVQDKIDREGYFEYEKNGYLIIGEAQIQNA